MKKYLIFSLIFFAKFALSQVNDNFDDGNFANNPVWTGSNSSSDFVIANGQLRSNSTTASTNFYLSTPSISATNCIWEFYCNLQFATSGSNYVDVYLTSDQQNLQSANINGYFVRIGNTNDEICLYKRSGAASSAVKIIDGADASVASTGNNRIKIKVTRTAANQFNLERDVSGLGTAYISEGTVTDATFTSSAYFGILIQQSTSSFFQKHFFDDISINPLVVDVTPPKALSASILTENSVEVVFDEPVDEISSRQLTNYVLNNGVGNPVSVIVGADATRAILAFSSAFSTANYSLTVSNVADKNNNTMVASSVLSFSYIQPYVVKKGDILINEIFADPSPQIDLPGVEFVELWNTSSEAISLQNWKYSDPTSTVALPAYTLKPNELVILCAKADTAEFKAFGNVVGISPWPSLNNSSDILKLSNAKGLTIDSVAYRDAWYRNTEKKAGGWSLELIDERAICKGGQNWMASTASVGGTPGTKNSVYHIYSSGPLSLKEAALADSQAIKLVFNKSVDSLIAANVANYSCNNGLGKPSSVKISSPDFTAAELKFDAQITRGRTYKVEVNGVTDCAGTLITGNTAEFIYPEKIAKGNLLISEVLFNPRPDGVDFVEIYNNSDVQLDLSDLFIATIKADTLSSVKQVSNGQYLLSPKSYLVLTTDPDNVKKEYHTENTNAFLKMASLPGFNDDAGAVVLLSKGVRIDQFSYTSKMHFSLIKDVEGVSLERISFKRSADEQGNFHSAAASAGFATPGYRNSQMVDEVFSSEEVSLASKTFSPDNDGFEDALMLNYNFKEDGLVGNASVYNNQGILVRKLYKNTTLSTSGTLIWDGTDDKSNKAAVGIYVLYLEVFDLKGNTRKYRRSCVLAAKL